MWCNESKILPSSHQGKKGSMSCCSISDAEISTATAMNLAFKNPIWTKKPEKPA